MATDLAWVLQFAVQLKRLRPEIDGADAARIGMQAFARTTGLAPEDAARIYSIGLPLVEELHTDAESIGHL